MKQIVIDASVVVKWFIEEKDSEKAITVRDEFIEGKIDLMSPNLLHYEVLNALKYSKKFNNDELKEAAISITNYGIIQVALREEYAQKVIKIATENDISIYDAAYVGLAEVLNTEIYTADKKLREKLKEEYHEKVVLISKLE